MRTGTVRYFSIRFYVIFRIHFFSGYSRPTVDLYFPFSNFTARKIADVRYNTTITKNKPHTHRSDSYFNLLSFICKCPSRRLERSSSRRIINGTDCYKFYSAPRSEVAPDRLRISNGKTFKTI